ncbi:MAG: hypothetical protein ACI4M6_04575 [Christensenellaceae bacterium]
MSEKMYAETEAEGLDQQAVKCASCGGNMVFDPATQNLVCQHCGSVVEFDKDGSVAELDIRAAFDNVETCDDSKVLRCSNCGAVMEVDSDDIALFCPYCHTSHVLKTEDIKGIKPNAIYPFTISSEQAVVYAKKWAKSKFFAPKSFKKTLTEKNIRGIYNPCWTFDSQTYTRYDGRVGDRKTRTVRTKNGTRTETYIVWRSISGEISRRYDDVTISASNSFEQRSLERIMNCSPTSIRVYEKKYLAGFYANHYQKDVKQSWDEAKSFMDSDIRKAIAQKHHAEVVDYINTSTVHKNVTYKYVLLPVWALFFPYKKKRYEVFVNGNTGLTTGKSPVSFLKVLLAVGLGCLLVLVIFLLAYCELRIADDAFTEIVSQLLI